MAEGCVRVEGRGGFLHETASFGRRPNHLLQIVGYLAMEPPLRRGAKRCARREGAAHGSPSHLKTVLGSFADIASRPRHKTRTSDLLPPLHLFVTLAGMAAVSVTSASAST